MNPTQTLTKDLIMVLEETHKLKTSYSYDDYTNFYPSLPNRAAFLGKHTKTKLKIVHILYHISKKSKKRLNVWTWGGNRRTLSTKYW